MPQLKPPQNTDKENEKPKPQLSILTDIEKSAKVEMENLGRVVSGMGQPISGILSATDLATSTRVISDIVNSPSFQIAGKALADTQKLVTTLAEPMFRINEAGRALIEPIQRIQQSVLALNTEYRFDISTKALSLLDNPALANPVIDWDGIVYSPKAYSPPKSLAVVVKEGMEVLATELISKIDQKFEERFDKFIEKAKIPVGIKNANCHCSKCGHLLMKITDISHFMSGTMKCGKCDETLQLPRDLRFEAQKD